jgi:hypothetical protein
MIDWATLAAASNVCWTRLTSIAAYTPLPPPLGCDGGFLYTVGGLKDGGSIMTIEQRLDQLEKRKEYLTGALTMMAVERHF